MSSSRCLSQRSKRSAALSSWAFAHMRAYAWVILRTLQAPYWSPLLGPMLPCGAFGTEREVHEQRSKGQRNKGFRYRAMGCSRLGAHLAPRQYLDLGLAEHAPSVRCQRRSILLGVMVPQFPATFQPGTFIPSCRRLVDPGCLLAHRDRPSSGGRYGIHVGYALRAVDSAAFLFSHCFAGRLALGAANPWL